LISLSNESFVAGTHLAEWKPNELGLNESAREICLAQGVMLISNAQHNYRIAVLITLLMLCSASGLAQQQTSDAERELFNAVNRERKAHGLSSLNLDKALADAARKHAERMAEQGTISHQLPGEPNLLSRARAAGAHFSWISENVDEGPNPTAIHQSFMKSPQHRANILDGDMDSTGIGVVKRNGQLFAVEDFSKAK
jgi:uncharacterized protein YkwD